ncbi:MAG: succinate dehydrogenase assembly factor 2 [Alphaproteobacteria bacterium]|nr:succinate dehydrogenase assembly factor 2 [Alphaproteobacteria bacterium]
MADPFDSRLKRLLFLSRHRGTQENDLLLGRFAASRLAALTPEELDQYEALLEVGDVDLFNWIVGRTPVPPAHDTPVMRMIIDFNEKE